MTPNFFVTGNASENEIKLTARRLESFRETFRTLFPQIRSDGGTRTNVLVFKNAESFAPFKPTRTDGTIDDGVAGYFQSGESINYIALAASEKPGAYTTIFHEYVHNLLEANIGRADLPPWLNEGLAEYFETLHVSDNGDVTMGLPPAGHIALLRKDKLIPLKTFFSTDNSALHRQGDRSRTFFYAQAWALTHYLLHGGVVNARERLDQLISLMRAKDARSDALTKLLKTDQTQLEAELRKHIDLSELPRTRTKVAVRLDTAIEMNAAPVSGSQSSAILGDLLFRTGRIGEAEVLLKKALTLDERTPLANTSLGLIRVRQKRFVQARSFLERAIAADRSNYFAYFNYAYALSRESADDNGDVTYFPAGDAAIMQEALAKAIELKPEFVESYRLLALIRSVEDTDLGSSVALLKKGLAYRPGDESLRLLLAKIYLRQENYLEAKEMAQNVASAASSEYVWSEANSVIETADQYFAAKAAGSVERTDGGVFGRLPPLILKRSAVTDSDVARIEEDRMVFNLNLLIDRPRFAERQFVGHVGRIACTNGEITFDVESDGEAFTLTSETFKGIKMGVLTEGERSFTIDCGVKLGSQLAVMTYIPAINTKPAIRGRLISIWFVPDYFRLKTAEEMAARRTVIIEDDRLFHKSRSTQPQPDRQH